MNAPTPLPSDPVGTAAGLPETPEAPEAPEALEFAESPEAPESAGGAAAPVVVVGGCKGGAGKSLTTLAVVDFLRQRGVPLLLVETDTSNPDVWRMHRGEDGLIVAALDLDEAEGWIDLINLCDEYPERVAVINTAARNNKGVTAHGPKLNRARPELGRRLVTLWVINNQRDSVELLADYLSDLPGEVTHVVRNTFFGPPETFRAYAELPAAAEVARRGGQVLTLPRLATRAADDLYSRRLSVRRAVARGSPDALPLGNRAELECWREQVARMFEAVLPSEVDRWRDRAREHRAPPAEARRGRR